MSRSNISKVQRKLNHLAADLADAEDMLAHEMRAIHVLPFCKKTGLSFNAGAGWWAFYNDDCERVDIREMRGTKRLLAVLDAECSTGAPLGSLMDDVDF